MDIDSNNDGGFAVPLDNLEEDWLELDDTAAKLVPVNDSDIDRDGIVDYNDFDNGITGGTYDGHFVPMTVRLSENVAEAGLESLDDITLRFEYPATYLRLWMPGKDASVPRTKKDIIPSSVPIGLSRFVTSLEDLSEPIIVYVEAIQESTGPMEIDVIAEVTGTKTRWTTAENGALRDSVQVKSPKHVDIDTDSDNDIDVDRMGDEDEIEYIYDGTQVGKRIFWNLDDDNMNGIADLNDVAENYDDILNDDDFAKIVFDAHDLSDFEGGYLYLGVSNGLRIHGTRGKVTLEDVASPAPEVITPAPGSIYSFYYRWEIGSESSFDPITCYVEGRSVGHHHVWWRLVDEHGYIVEQDEVRVNVESIVWPSNGCGSSLKETRTTEWDGFCLSTGWYIEKSLEELIQPSADHGFIRTHYPQYMTDETLESDPDDSEEEVEYSGLMGTNHGSAPAQSMKKYMEGFEMNLTFEFVGSPYVEAHQLYAYSEDKNHEGASFFRNSGVYIYDHYEVQIYDTPSLVTALNSGLAADVDGASRTIRGDVADGEVKLYHETSRYWDGLYAPVNGCITGIPYKQGDFTTLAQLEDAAELIEGTNTMTIDVTPNQAGGITLAVTLNGETIFQGWVKESTGVGRHDGADPHVYLQSHWGSGVKFTSATITPK